MLAEAIDYLDAHQTDFIHQLGGARNFGGGIVDCELMNPLYQDHELRRVFDRSKGPTERMQAKDDEWVDAYLPALQTALADRLEGSE